MTAGYPTSPIAEQLGFKPGMRVFVVAMPDSVRNAIALDSLGLELFAAPSAGIDAALIFASDREKLECELKALSQLLAAGGSVWVFTREQAADGQPGVTPDVVRQVGSSTGLCEVGAGRIDDGWSGLKLMATQKHS